MASIRDICTTIQSAQPSAWSRVTEAAPAGAVSYTDLDALKIDLSSGDLPAGISFDGVTLQLASEPTGLADGGDNGEGELAGQVALVSGAASGLGLGVARGLYAAGACVCLTDIDEAGLKAVAAEFNNPARIDYAVVNVTDEESVIAGFDSALARWGRVDAIACCAGIAPPFNLVDFPLDKWRLAMEINLTGYFLMGREAARIMQAQGHGGSMVLLSSKSGLEPSKANSAYNATKAGELHLARGWALNLVAMAFA